MVIHHANPRPVPHRSSDSIIPTFRAKETLNIKGLFSERSQKGLNDDWVGEINDVVDSVFTCLTIYLRLCMCTTSLL
jgi:hypothetical protein